MAEGKIEYIPTNSGTTVKYTDPKTGYVTTQNFAGLTINDDKKFGTSMIAACKGFETFTQNFKAGKVTELSSSGLSSDDIVSLQQFAKENGLSTNLTNSGTMSNLGIYAQPNIQQSQILSDMPGFMQLVSEKEQLTNSINDSNNAIQGYTNEIGKNDEDIYKSTMKMTASEINFPGIADATTRQNAKIDYQNATQDLLDFEIGSSYILNLAGLAKQEEMTEPENGNDAFRNNLKNALEPILKDKYAIVDNNPDYSDEYKEELKQLIRNEYIAKLQKQKTDLKKAESDAKAKNDAVETYEKLLKEKEEKEKANKKLEEERKKQQDSKDALEKQRQEVEDKISKNRLNEENRTSTTQELNQARTAAKKAGKPSVAQGSGSGSFANPGQTLNENVTYYSIEKGEIEGTYKIKGGTSDPIDLEQYRYYQSNEAHRVGYTLLACGTYSDNVYNNNNSGNKAYNQLNSISFILPLPDSSVKLATKATWQEQNEEGINEAAAALADKNNGKNVIAAGVNKFAQAKIMELAGKYGINGALRGVALAYNPNKQLYFEGVELDSFDMSFSLVPKNKEEAIKIKIFAEAINMLMLPGTSNNGSNINALQKLSDLWSSASNTLGNGNSILSGIAKTIAGWGANAASWVTDIMGGNSDGLSSPYFSYPGLWTVGVYVPTKDGMSSGQPDFCILERNRLAMTSCDLTFGGEKITWHDDGFPTVMKMTLSFKESQYRVKENMANLVSFLGGSNNFAEYKDTVTSNLEQERQQEAGRNFNKNEPADKIIQQYIGGIQSKSDLVNALVEKRAFNNKTQAEIYLDKWAKENNKTLPL